LLFGIKHLFSIEHGYFTLVTHEDGFFRTGLFTVSTKNANSIIDVKNIGPSFILVLFAAILTGFNVNAISRAGNFTKAAGNASWLPVFVLRQNRRPDKSDWLFHLFFRVIDSHNPSIFFSTQKKRNEAKQIMKETTRSEPHPFYNFRDVGLLPPSHLGSSIYVISHKGTPLIQRQDYESGNKNISQG
jgi:hypothetical protein